MAFEYDLEFTDDDYDTALAVEPSSTEENCTVLSFANIRQRQDDDIIQVSSVLSLPRPATTILLHHYKWNANTLQDHWFTDETSVRNAVGLPAIAETSADPPKSHRLRCGICFEKHRRHRMPSAACGAHRYCRDCWKGYVKSAINDGPGCLSLRCPDPSCSAAVGIDIVDNVSGEDERVRYAQYLVSSYVEDNRRIKWCPAPGCEFAVEFVIGSERRDVRCRCLNSFCWDCTEEAHRPVDCETVANWMLKNTSEAENTKWILAYTKSCPKCERNIEKNDGCNHMTCRAPCHHQFCWHCLQPWTEHNNSYMCNRYDKKKLAGEVEEKQETRLLLERYKHYYERWASNHRSRQKAMEDLRGLQLDKLSSTMELGSEWELKFVTEAWMQIVECRRVLKWTYAYGYYMMVRDPDETKKEYFELVQGDAEFALEKLHGCAEQELGVFINSYNAKKTEFYAFRTKLEGLTRVARNYFDNLVRALETGLQDIATTGTVRGGQHGTKKKRKGGDVEESSSSQDRRVARRRNGSGLLWQCNLCTYMNTGNTRGTLCRICLSCRHCTYTNPVGTTSCLVCGDTARIRNGERT